MHLTWIACNCWMEELIATAQVLPAALHHSAQAGWNGRVLIPVTYPMPWGVLMLAQPPCETSACPATPQCGPPSAGSHPPQPAPPPPNCVEEPLC